MDEAFEEINPFWYAPIPRQCHDDDCTKDATHRVYWGSLGFTDYCAPHADARVSWANEDARKARERRDAGG